MKNASKPRGFSVTELLIVIVMLALAGSIAISETVSSRTRSNVARARMDMRRTALALEAYRTDHAAYPIIDAYAATGGLKQFNLGPVAGISSLTTPVAYLTSVDIRDPFIQPVPGFTAWVNYINVKSSFQYIRPGMPVTPANRPAWYLASVGPDRIKGPSPFSSAPWWFISDYALQIDPDKTCHFDAWQYDPSNGTLSHGDILGYSWRK